MADSIGPFNLASTFAVLDPQAGAYRAIPRDTWHTAKTTGCRMLFITPGQGTENRPL